MNQDGRPWVRIGVICLSILVIGVIALLVWLLSSADAERRESMWFEVFKSSLQLVLIGVVGGSIALLYKWIERSWETTRQQSELRQDYVSRLGDAYRGVKQVRRILRANGFASADQGALTPGQVTVYDEQMQAISQEQLRLEALVIESASFPLAQGSKVLTSQIRRMEQYLGRIIDEYEDVRSREVLSLAEMRRISEMTSRPDPDRDRRLGTFQENFVKPHYRAIGLVAGRQASEDAD